MALAIVTPQSWHRPWWPSPWWHHTRSISGPCPRGTTLVSPPLMALAPLWAPHSWHRPWLPSPLWHHTRGISGPCPLGIYSASHSWLPCGYGGPHPHHTRGSALLRPFWCLPSWHHIWEFALGGPRPRSRCCPQQCRRGQCSHVSLVDAVIGCRRCMPRSRACRRRSTRRGVPLAALAAVVSMPSLSSAVDVTQPTRVRTAAWCGLPLTALAAVVGYTVVGCRVGLAIALISCCRCSHRWRA